MVIMAEHDDGPPPMDGQPTDGQPTDGQPAGGQPPRLASGGDGVTGVRVGNVERDAAMRALDVHLSAGRLDVDEYGQRYAKASLARTQDELTVLFIDLPEPHGLVTEPPRAPVPSAGPRPTGPSGAPLFGRLGETVVAVSPFVALLLFFVVAHAWWVFLLIPISGAVVYGNARGGRRNRARYRGQGPGRC